jgi:hypothetical protein
MSSRATCQNHHPKEAACQMISGTLEYRLRTKTAGQKRRGLLQLAMMPMMKVNSMATQLPLLMMKGAYRFHHHQPQPLPSPPRHQPQPLPSPPRRAQLQLRATF